MSEDFFSSLSQRFYYLGIFTGIAESTFLMCFVYPNFTFIAFFRFSELNFVANIYPQNSAWSKHLLREISLQTKESGKIQPENRFIWEVKLLAVLMSWALCSLVHKDDKTGTGVFTEQRGKVAPCAAQRPGGARLDGSLLHLKEPQQLWQYLLLDSSCGWEMVYTVTSKPVQASVCCCLTKHICLLAWAWLEMKLTIWTLNF